VAAGLNDLLYEIDVGIDLENDTSIPAELRGKWVIDNELQKNLDEEQWKMLFDKSSELSVEFDRICFGGKCDGYEAVLDVRGGKDEVDDNLTAEIKKYIGDKEMISVKRTNLIISNRQENDEVEVLCVDGDLLFIIDEDRKISIVLSRVR
jgi:hypothetical protein